MKKTFRMYELSGADACNQRRSFSYAVKANETDIFKKAIATKSVIKDYFNGLILFPDLEDAIRKGMSEISFLSEEQRDIQTMDTLRQVQRFIMSEERNPIEAPPADVDISEDLTIIVSPDYYYINPYVTKEGEPRYELELIKIKCSKPNITQAKASEDLGLYSMLKYAQIIAKNLNMEEITDIKASYYFLGKDNDRFSTDKPNFDTDFFNTTGGRNIVSLSDDIDMSWSDFHFSPIVEKFSEGIPADECNTSDCEKCSLYDICQYNEPPIAIVKENVAKSAQTLKLTPSQQEAIEYEEGVCRINAGAGAGKTMVVALRTATLIMKGVKPKEICLVTFTNAGAEEMRLRIKMYLEDFGLDDVDISEMTIQTFNAFGDAIIKEEYAKVGFSEAPTVIDDTERSSIIASLLNEAVAEERFDATGEKVKNPLKSLNWRNFTANNLYVKGAITVAKEVFDVMKAGNYTAADLSIIKRELGQTYSRFIPSQQCLLELAMLYDKYDEILKEENLIEFADQQVLVFELLHDDPYYFEQFGFQHIIVDEFQDSDEGQIEMIKLLYECPSTKSLMVVGDDSQSIYGFRGTSNKFIIHFDEYIGRKVDDIYLLENHRSTPEIIDFANAINANNQDRIEKDLIATRPSGKPVFVQGFLTTQEEREFVVNSIKEHLDNGVSPEDIAVEAFTKHELQVIADMLQKEGIPSVMLVPEPLLENARVRAAIALVNALNDSTATQDILTYANAYIGGGIINQNEKEIEDKINFVTDLLNQFYEKETEAEKKEFLMTLLHDIDHNDDEVYQSFLEKLERKNVKKIFEYIQEFYFYGANTAVRRNHDYPGVVLTTAHSSKGLEWNIVYDMISKFHPENRSLSTVEEKRRLLFVSATRARDELYITGQYVANGKKGDYTYNTFLIESYKVLGQDFNISSIEAERQMREDERKAERESKKKEKKAELERVKALQIA